MRFYFGRPKGPRGPRRHAFSLEITEEGDEPKSSSSSSPKTLTFNPLLEKTGYYARNKKKQLSLSSNPLLEKTGYYARNKKQKLSLSSNPLLEKTGYYARNPRGGAPNSLPSKTVIPFQETPQESAEDKQNKQDFDKVEQLFKQANELNKERTTKRSKERDVNSEVKSIKSEIDIRKSAEELTDRILDRLSRTGNEAVVDKIDALHAELNREINLLEKELNGLNKMKQPEVPPTTTRVPPKNKARGRPSRKSAKKAKKTPKVSKAVKTLATKLKIKLYISSTRGKTKVMKKESVLKKQIRKVTVMLRRRAKRLGIKLSYRLKNKRLQKSAVRLLREIKKKK